eukprot:352298-Chlamydomonas_euryale.AAC.1
MHTCARLHTHGAPQDSSSSEDEADALDEDDDEELARQLEAEMNGLRHRRGRGAKAVHKWQICRAWRGGDGWAWAAHGRGHKRHISRAWGGGWVAWAAHGHGHKRYRSRAWGGGGTGMGGARARAQAVQIQSRGGGDGHGRGTGAGKSDMDPQHWGWTGSRAAQAWALTVRIWCMMVRGRHNGGVQAVQVHSMGATSQCLPIHPSTYRSTYQSSIPQQLHERLVLSVLALCKQARLLTHTHARPQAAPTPSESTPKAGKKKSGGGAHAVRGVSARAASKGVSYAESDEDDSDGDAAARARAAKAAKEPLPAFEEGSNFDDEVERVRMDCVCVRGLKSGTAGRSLRRAATSTTRSSGCARTVCGGGKGGLAGKSFGAWR